MSASPELRDCHDCAADELRAAARLMRERTEAATPGRWHQMCLGSEGCQVLNDGHLRDRRHVGFFGRKEWKADHADAEYVAGMQPSVALAVARMLEELAEHAAQGSQGALVADGLDIARAYTELRI